jgi:hypothetical protein
MKRFVILLSAIVLFSTAAKADWTPGTLMLGQFQQELYSAHDAKNATTAGIGTQLKNQLSALIGWSNRTEPKVRP